MRGDFLDRETSLSMSGTLLNSLQLIPDSDIPIHRLTFADCLQDGQ